MKLAKLIVVVWSVWLIGGAAAGTPETTWRFGAAQTKITPEKPFWMAGFAARTRPAEGTLDDLWAKALVLEDETGARAVVVSMDLLGLPGWLYNDLCRELKKRHGLNRSQVMFAASHTHSGPVLRDALQDIYPLDAEQKALIAEYSDQLKDRLLNMIGSALAARRSARVFFGQGRATLAVNRRTNDESKLGEMIARGESPRGPSDFAVPVLAVRADDGRWQAVVFGYAAHTSALTDNYRWSGDYAGVTQRALEAQHPGAVALFIQGCGSDQSAAPRGTIERCQKLGQSLAAAVESVLDKPMTPVHSRARAAFQFISLDYGEQPALAELEALGAGTGYRARWARRLASDLRAGKAFDKGYREYPVQVWKLGTDRLWIALGGEVCVDYAFRFKREFGPQTWVTGYANDVMAYIPSRRLWEEGGYQAGAFDVYGLPANRWCADIEDRIAGAVARLVKRMR